MFHILTTVKPTFAPPCIVPYCPAHIHSADIHKLKTCPICTLGVFFSLSLLRKIKNIDVSLTVDVVGT